MRLIDADKTNVYTYELNKQVFVDAITRFISLQPTVNAIPIDWLRMWFTKKGALIGIVLMGEIESDWENENERMDNR